MYDRNGKIGRSERILTKLVTVVPEYICDKIIKFHEKALSHIAELVIFECR